MNEDQQQLHDKLDKVLHLFTINRDMVPESYSKIATDHTKRLDGLEENQRELKENQRELIKTLKPISDAFAHTKWSVKAILWIVTTLGTIGGSIIAIKAGFFHK